MVIHSGITAPPTSTPLFGVQCYVLFPAPPQLLSRSVPKMGREPGRFHHVHTDVLGVVLCIVLVIELAHARSLGELNRVPGIKSPC